MWLRVGGDAGEGCGEVKGGEVWGVLRCAHYGHGNPRYIHSTKLPKYSSFSYWSIAMAGYSCSRMRAMLVCVSVLLRKQM